MINISSSMTTAQQAEAVFEFVRDQDNVRLWLSGWLETQPTSTTEGVGFTWVDVIKVFVRRVETEFELTAYEPGRQLAFRSKRGSFPIKGVYSFVPIAKGTAVTFTLEGEPDGFFKLAEPLLSRMLQRQWNTNLANIKDVIETTA